MKSFLPYLQVGQKVYGEVEEIQPQGQLVVSFHGDLIRVMNSSRREFKKGDRLELVVWSLEPLEFRLPSGSSRLEKII